jgi:hypothetical protein
MATAATAQTSCSASCAGTTSDGTPFDLSALMGQDYQTTGSDQNSDTYFLNVCGTSATQCPDDAGDPPVTQGTAVQTVASGGCYVLGAYTGDNCLWTANPGGQEGIQLVLDNGSNNLCGDGSPRQVTIAFICPNAGSSGPLTPNTWTAVNLPGSCEYTYTFETCAACSSGCSSGPGPKPPPGPGPAPPGPASKGAAWYDWVWIFTLIGSILYISIGAFLNYKQGKRGAEMFYVQPEFWGSVWANVKAGIVFTFTCGKSSGGSTSGDSYSGMGASSGTSSESYQDTDNKGVGSVDF